MAYHNICKKTHPPEDIGKLLGLGLKFCIQNRRPDKASIVEGMSRLRRDVRLKYIFTENHKDLEDIDYDYNPKLYIKSKWQPPPVNNNAKIIITNFQSAFEDARGELHRRTKHSTNIAPAVESLLSSTMTDKSLIIVSKDKNLGPVVMD